MSKNFKGYMGDQIGKLGTAVGRRWKGKMVYSAYQGKVSNPKTEAQQTVRARFAMLGRLGAVMMPALVYGLAENARRQHQTVGASFTSLNFDATTGNVVEGVEVNYPSVRVSAGSLRGVSFGTPSFTNPGSVSVGITENYKGTYGAADDDVVMMAVYCDELEDCLVSDGTALRTSNTVSVSVPESWQGMKVHAWGFVRGKNGKTSRSMYLGSGTVA